MKEVKAKTVILGITGALLLLILIAGTLVEIMFSFIALEQSSIWNSAILGYGIVCLIAYTGAKTPLHRQKG